MLEIGILHINRLFGSLLALSNLHAYIHAYTCMPKVCWTNAACEHYSMPLTMEQLLDEGRCVLFLLLNLAPVHASEAGCHVTCKWYGEALHLLLPPT